MKEYALQGKRYEASKISLKDLDLLLKIAQEHATEMPVAKITREIHEKYQKEL